MQVTFEGAQAAGMLCCNQSWVMPPFCQSLLAQLGPNNAVLCSPPFLGACRCDGSEPQRKYYDKLARLMPLNTMVSVHTCTHTPQIAIIQASLCSVCVI